MKKNKSNYEESQQLKFTFIEKKQSIKRNSGCATIIRIKPSEQNKRDDLIEKILMSSKSF